MRSNKEEQSHRVICPKLGGIAFNILLAHHSQKIAALDLATGNGEDCNQGWKLGCRRTGLVVVKKYACCKSDMDYCAVLPRLLDF
jgi:hypothetical protein